MIHFTAKLIVASRLKRKWKQFSWKASEILSKNYSLWNIFCSSSPRSETREVKKMFRLIFLSRIPRLPGLSNLLPKYFLIFKQVSQLENVSSSWVGKLLRAQFLSRAIKTDKIEKKFLRCWTRRAGALDIGFWLGSGLLGSDFIRPAM